MLEFTYIYVHQGGLWFSPNATSANLVCQERPDLMLVNTSIGIG